VAEILLTAFDRETIAAHLAHDPPHCPSGVRPGSWSRLLAGTLDFVDFSEWPAIWAVLPAPARWLLMTAERTQRWPSHRVPWKESEWIVPDGGGDPPVVGSRPSGGDEARSRQLTADSWETSGRLVLPDEDAA